ncbi:MAG: hypothetical protein ACPF8V_07655, partial [Luteibaculum sp.]
MQKPFYFLLFSLLFSLASPAQNFFKLLGEPGIEDGLANIIEGPDSTLYLTGSNDLENILLYHFDLNGNELSKQKIRVNGIQQPRVMDAMLSPDGNSMIFAGGSFNSATDWVAFIMKYNLATGAAEWTYTSDTKTRFFSIEYDPTRDHYHFLGSYNDVNQFNWSDGVHVAFDANGNQVSNINFYDLDKDESLVASTNSFAVDGFLYGAGRYTTGNSNVNSYRANLTKLDRQGKIIWTKTLIDNASANSRNYCQDVVFHNNFLYTLSYRFGPPHVGYVSKLDTAGNEIWTTELVSPGVPNTTNNTYRFDQIVMHNGDPVVLATDYDNAWLVKLSNNGGATILSRKKAISADQTAFSETLRNIPGGVSSKNLYVDNDLNLYLAFSTDFPDNSDHNIAFMKFDQNWSSPADSCGVFDFPHGHNNRSFTPNQEFIKDRIKFVQDSLRARVPVIEQLNISSPCDSDFEISPDRFICTGDQIEIEVTGASNYRWISGAATLSCNNCANPIATPTQTTTYRVVVSKEGCCDKELRDTLETTISIVPSIPLVTEFLVGPEVCFGDTAVLQITNVSGMSPWYFEWRYTGSPFVRVDSLQDDTYILNLPSAGRIEIRSVFQTSTCQVQSFLIENILLVDSSSALSARDTAICANDFDFNLNQLIDDPDFDATGFWKLDPDTLPTGVLTGSLISFKDFPSGNYTFKYREGQFCDIDTAVVQIAIENHFKPRLDTLIFDTLCSTSSPLS